MFKIKKKDDEIEILDVYHNEKLKKKKFKVKNKFALTLMGFFTVFILIGTISFIMRKKLW